MLDEPGERIVRTEVEPAAGMSLRHARALLELARGRYQEALAASVDAERLAAPGVSPSSIAWASTHCQRGGSPRFGDDLSPAWRRAWVRREGSA